MYYVYIKQGLKIGASLDRITHVLACGLRRLNHERLKHAHPGVSLRKEPPQLGAYASLLPLGFYRGHHLQRQVPKFLPPFRAVIALCCEGVVVVTATAIVAAIVTTTISNPTTSTSDISTTKP